MSRRSTQEQILMQKVTLIEMVNSGDMKVKEASKILNIHPKSFSRIKKGYNDYGIDFLVPKKPGPKKGRTIVHNRTPKEVEDLVAAYGVKYPNMGPIGLADKLLENHNITIHDTTVWRILKRRGIRYTREYKRWKKDPILYCKDFPGIELQMDASYPFGRERQIAVFSAIDDCSRWIYSKVYNTEDADSAIHFVTELIKRSPFHIKHIRVDNRYGKRLNIFCETLGIGVIRNPPYSPEKNGKIERFHKTLKREFFWPKCSFYDPKEVLQYKLNLWIGHYNYNRKHTGFGMNKLTPAQKIANTYKLSLANHYPQRVTGTLQQYKT